MCINLILFHFTSIYLISFLHPPDLSIHLPNLYLLYHYGLHSATPHRLACGGYVLIWWLVNGLFYSWWNVNWLFKKKCDLWIDQFWWLVNSCFNSWSLVKETYLGWWMVIQVTHDSGILVVGELRGYIAPLTSNPIPPLHYTSPTTPLIPQFTPPIPPHTTLPHPPHPTSPTPHRLTYLFIWI